MLYRFRCKVLYAGKLRILTVEVPGTCDMIGIFEEVEQILEVDTLAATQLVSVERIEDSV